MTLNNYVEPLAWEMAVWLERFFDPVCPIAHLGKISMELTKGLRSLAVLQLLARDDRVHFFSNLLQSARVRLHFLNRLRLDGVADDHHQASARYKPLLDAVAAGEKEVAQQIIQITPSEFRDGHEYMDDYCFAQILMKIISGEFEPSAYDALIESYASYLDGMLDPRFRVSGALIAGNQEEFDDSFEDLLRWRSMEIQKMKEKGQMEDADVAANRFVYVDALALLKLAEWRGIKTETEYSFCPSAARI